MAESRDNWKVLGIRRIRGKIRVVTGLRIGASQDTMEISGLDNPIIRNPANDEPYIPGSSLKGKMRSLTEWFLGELPGEGDPVKADPRSRTARVFGISASKERENGPTRLLIRDAALTDEWREKFGRGVPITEVKHENSINRLTSMANPRPMERVVPGVTFDFELVYRILDTGDNGKTDEQNYEDVVLAALSLLESDYLGSSGSRGCGQIQFVDLKDENGKEIRLSDLAELEKRAG